MTPTDLIALQKRARLSLPEFARILDISTSTLANWQGKRPNTAAANRDITAIVIDRAETLGRYLDIIGVR